MNKKKNLFLTLAIIILLASLLLWGYNHYKNISLDKASDAFYLRHQSKLSDKNNLAVAYAGFNAPVGQNVFEYGRLKIDAFFKPRSHTDQEKPWQVKDYPNELVFIEWDRNQETDCEGIDDIPVYVESCLNPVQVKSLLQQNRVLLERYQSLFPLNHWQGPTTPPHQIDFLMVNILLGIKVNWLVHQGSAEAGYELWKQNYLFVLKILKFEIDIHENVGFQIALQTSLHTLVNLLKSAPKVLIKHYEELEQLLLLNGMDKYNIEGLLRASYYREVAFMHANKDAMQIMDMAHFKRRLFLLHQDFLALSKVAVKDLPLFTKAIKRKYDAPMLQSKYQALKYKVLKTLHGIVAPKVVKTDVFLDFTIIFGYFHPEMLSFRTMHANNAYLRLVKAAIDIKKQGVQSNHVQDFLKELGESYICPFTETSMQYNKKTQTIYCDDQKVILHFK